jgi:hypothetical protein
MKKTQLGRILISIDQLGNTLAGGNEDCTISARLGYLYINRPMWWATMLMYIVDFTFYAADGPHHCLTAYLNDQNESFRRGSDVGLAILSIITIPFCIILFIPVLIYAHVRDAIM